MQTSLKSLFLGRLMDITQWNLFTIRVLVFHEEIILVLKRICVVYNEPLLGFLKRSFTARYPSLKYSLEYHRHILLISLLPTEHIRAIQSMLWWDAVFMFQGSVFILVYMHDIFLFIAAHGPFIYTIPATSFEQILILDIFPLNITAYF